jgi:hypothetical protein
MMSIIHTIHTIHTYYNPNPTYNIHNIHHTPCDLCHCSRVFAERAVFNTWKVWYKLQKQVGIRFQKHLGLFMQGMFRGWAGIAHSQHRLRLLTYESWKDYPRVMTKGPFQAWAGHVLAVKNHDQVLSFNAILLLCYCLLFISSSHVLAVKNHDQVPYYCAICMCLSFTFSYAILSYCLFILTSYTLYYVTVF